MKRKAAATKTKQHKAAASRSRKTAKHQEKPSTRSFELKGLCVFAIGLIGLCGFFGLNVGFVGVYLAKFFSYLFGIGAIVVDFVIMLLGYRLITQHRGLNYTLSLFGYVLLFGALLAIWHHFRIPVGEEIMPDSLPKGGGLVGGAILFLLRKFVGVTGAIIVLFLGALASVLLSTSWSLAPGLLKTQKKVEKGAEVTRKAVARGAAATANATGSVVKEAASAARDAGNRVEERWQEHVEEQRLEREERARQRQLRAQQHEKMRGTSFYNQDEDAHFAELNDSVIKPKKEKPTSPEDNAEQATVVLPKITISGIGKVKEEEKAEAVDSFLETPPENRRWLGTMTGKNAAKYGVATAFTVPHQAEAKAEAEQAEASEAEEAESAKTAEMEQSAEKANAEAVQDEAEKTATQDVDTSEAEAAETAQDDAETAEETVPAEVEDDAEAIEADEDTAEEDAEVVEPAADESAKTEAKPAVSVPQTAPVVSPSPSPMKKNPVPMPSYSEISPIAPAKEILEGNSLDAKRAAEGVAQEAKYAAVNQPPAKPYVLPKVTEILTSHPKPYNAKLEEEIEEKAQTLQQTLTDFKVKAKILNACHGPAVTRYEIEPAPGVKVSKITNLADDIALRLAATSVRIEQIPGKSAIGIEVPNAKLESVALREVLDNPKFAAAKSKLTVGLGMDISGEAIFADLAKMPHLLVAGATGSGKSVCINTLITSILFKAKPDEVKFILVDPKMVELSNYNGIPHLMVPVVTDAKKAASVLNWSVQEMEKRYATFAEEGVRNMASYNKKFPDAKMPAIVIIIDELADLMMVAPHDVEDAICRLAQKARAAGIHMVLATQRPSVDVITGIIKANIPSRISFAVSSQIDSRTILDRSGAEKLLGKGDMLFYPVGAPKPRRVQGAFVSDEEVEKLLDFIRSQGQEMEPNEEIEAFTEAQLAEEEAEEEGKSGSQAKKTDALLEKAVEHVMTTKKASSSSIQRRLGIGYTRAARLVDTMEALHIVGPNIGSKPREILMTSDQANAAVAKLRASES